MKPTVKPTPSVTVAVADRAENAPKMPAVRHYADISIAAATREAVELRIADDTNSDRGGWVITANLDHLRCLNADRTGHLRSLFTDADLVVADGMPLIWAARLAGRPLPERIAGSDMMLGLPARIGARGGSVFLLGGRPGAADAAARILTERSEVRIAGTACPPLGFDRGPEHLDEVCRSVAATKPDVVFVALGFPKQDEVIRRLRAICPSAWCIGVGASVDFLAGHSQRAPVWMQRTGTEWLHRLAQEPGRLGRRYLVHGLPFAARLLAWSLRARRHPVFSSTTASEHA